MNFDKKWSFLYLQIFFLKNKFSFDFDCMKTYRLSIVNGL